MTGLISVDVKDSMLCDKYREKQTQPDPGYSSGFIFENMTKKCSFYIMPKGPYDEMQTATMDLKSITITNRDEVSVESISIDASNVSNNTLSIMHDSDDVMLTANISPSNVSDKSVIWSSQDENIATVNDEGKLDLIGVGKTIITATSKINMSKSGVLELDVLSGYENDMAQMISDLQAISNNSESGLTSFDNIMNTTWSNMSETPSYNGNNDELNIDIEAGSIYIENYSTGQGANTCLVDIATASKVLIAKDGKVNVQEGVSTIELDVYLDGEKQIYTADVLIIRNNTVTKFSIEIVDTTLIKDYSPSDIVDTFTTSAEYLLAEGKSEISGDAVVITENNQVAAYGGVLSEKIACDTEKTIQIVIDIADTSHDNSVLWDLRILYFNYGFKVSNPRTLVATTQKGVSTIEFEPMYGEVCFYLVANGNDVSGDAREGASITVNYMKIQYLN